MASAVSTASPRLGLPKRLPAATSCATRTGQALVDIYIRATESDAMQAMVLAEDEARRIAVNIAKLRDLRILMIATTHSDRDHLFRSIATRATRVHRFHRKSGRSLRRCASTGPHVIRSNWTGLSATRHTAGLARLSGRRMIADRTMAGLAAARPAASRGPCLAHQGLALPTAQRLKPLGSAKRTRTRNP
jgi:hypothetical protein